MFRSSTPPSTFCIHCAVTARFLDTCLRCCGTRRRSTTQTLKGSMQTLHQCSKIRGHHCGAGFELFLVVTLAKMLLKRYTQQGYQLTKRFC